MNNQQISLFVIDECEMIRLGICAALQKEPAFNIVGTAGDITSALDQIDALQPTIVILDAPFIQSVEMLRAKLPHLRLLVVGLNDDVHNVREAFEVGADGYCTKGVRMEWLVTGIKMIAAGGRWASPSAVEALLSASKFGPAEARFAAKPVKGVSGPLSTREQEVLNLLVQGYSNTEIGAQLYLSPETIKTHVRHIMEKLCVRDRTHAAVEAVRRGLVVAC